MIAQTLTFFCLISLALCGNVFSSLEQCFTAFGTVSTKQIPTSRSTHTILEADATVQVTVYPTSVVTPAAVNQTSTVTQTQYTQSSIQGPVVTSTFSYTAYTTTRRIVTSTITTTSIYTSTIITTIPVPSGFLPIANTTASAYPGFGSSNSNATITALYSSSKVSSSAASSSSAKATTTRKGRMPFGLKERSNGKSFPRIVNCVKSVIVQATQIHTKTGKKVTQTLAPSTSSTVVTTTVTSTLPPRSVRGHTVWVTTAVATSTITLPAGYSRVTTTITASATATKKAYAACAANNQLGPILADKSTITSINYGLTSHVTTYAQSAEDCCAQCMEFSGCIGSGYGATGSCSLYYKNRNVCSAQSSASGEYYAQKRVNQALGLVVSNGACGYLFNGGDGF